MTQTLGTLVFQENKIILEYDEGYKEVFIKDKPDYSAGAQWIVYEEEKYFLKRD